MKKFNLKKIIEKIKKEFEKVEPHQKDFYDLYNYKLICGKCNKEKGFFHWCNKRG